MRSDREIVTHLSMINRDNFWIGCLYKLYVRFDWVVPKITSKIDMANGYILEVLPQDVFIVQSFYSEPSEDALAIIDLLVVGKTETTSTIMDLVNLAGSRTAIKDWTGSNRH